MCMFGGVSLSSPGCSETNVSQNFQCQSHSSDFFLTFGFNGFVVCHRAVRLLFPKPCVDIQEVSTSLMMPLLCSRQWFCFYSSRVVIVVIVVEILLCHTYALTTWDEQAKGS